MCVLVVLLLLQAHFITADSECRKDKGTCTLIYNCKAPNLLNLPLCGFERNTPIVCCPHSTSTNILQGPPGSRISVTKCKEYSTIVSRNVSALILTTDPNLVTLQVSECNYKNVHLIVGGEEVKLGEFPHMVALGYGEPSNPMFYCGGSLISENFVLTAAHCTKTNDFGDPKVARLGEHHLQRDDDGARPVNIDIAQVVVHPDYQPPVKYNDIALLRLARPATLSTAVRPACLPQSSPPSTSKAVATGWGRIAYSEDPSPVLLKVVLPMVDKATCSRLWSSAGSTSSSQLPRGIDHESMLCAGALAGGKDTCLGDSGGPLSVTNANNECVHYIVGVTSFGKYCGFRNSPGIYTRVSYYVPWIESVVWPNN